MTEVVNESLDDLFCEIWERESQPELRFPVRGVGSVVQTQDLHGHRWEVNNFSNTVWEAAIWMHHFFQDERCFPAEWLRGRRVLEIGAGAGLVGLTLALLGAEVTMTDLPEALPILRHNTEITFGTLSDGDGNSHSSSHGRESHGRAAGKPCRRPAIRKLCWGNAAEAAEVAAAAAAAAAVEENCSAWEGYDLIVGADVIYNERTFPALLSTLSDRRLCSEKTLVYLATMLRGGRHEGLLEMLNHNGFHVRALDPTCADDLRARVAGGHGNRMHNSSSSSSSCRQGDGIGIEVADNIAEAGLRGAAGAAGVTRTGGSRKWDDPEWERGRLPPERRRIPLGSRGQGRDSTTPAVDALANDFGDKLAENGPVASRASEGRRRVDGGVLFAKSGVGGGEGEGGGGDWGYKEHGLGKILAYVARRRDCRDACGDGDRETGGEN